MSPLKKIIRVWKGWTTLDNAPVYKDMLIHSVFPEVKKKGVKGLEKVSISTKEVSDEVEFHLILQFDNLGSVTAFAGDDYQKAYIPDEARPILSRFETTAQHYELEHELVF